MITKWLHTQRVTLVYNNPLHFIVIPLPDTIFGSRPSQQKLQCKTLTAATLMIRSEDYKGLEVFPISNKDETVLFRRERKFGCIDSNCKLALGVRDQPLGFMLNQLVIRVTRECLPQCQI